VCRIDAPRLISSSRSMALRSVDARTLGTTADLASPLALSMTDRAVVFCVAQRSAPAASRLRACWLAGLPPIHVSSAASVPDSSPADGPRFMASRMRWSMNHAVLGVSSYLRFMALRLWPGNR